METKKRETKTKEIIDYTQILTKIFYILIAITVISAANLIVNIAKNGSVATDSNDETEENTEYDVSMFTEKTTSEAIESIQKGETEIVYIGRSTCGYCVKFLPVLQQAQKEYGYTTTYIDLTKMSSDDRTNLLTLDDEDGYISENFGYTPMVLIFKDGKLSKGWVGYSEYDAFASFLEENGITK